MPFVTSHDGVKLFCVDVGAGTPILFAHEFAADLRSFESQIRHFSRKYRVIAYNARGYPPSQVPTDPAFYSQDHHVNDMLAVMNGLGLESAHIVGVSMGGFAAIHFACQHPHRVMSLTASGCGYGAKPGKQRQTFRRKCLAFADRFEKEGMEKLAQVYANVPTRKRFKLTDQRGWNQWERHLAQMCPRGCALTLRGVLSERPSLYDLKEDLQQLQVPTTIVVGDEDDRCLEVGVYLKRTIRASALAVLPHTGHSANLESPAKFSSTIEDFVHKVECGRWLLQQKREQEGNSDKFPVSPSEKEKLRSEDNNIPLSQRFLADTELFDTPMSSFLKGDARASKL